MVNRPEVESFIARLRVAQWFRSSGTPVAIPLRPGDPLARACSWGEALKVINSKWTNEFLIESQNVLYRERSEAQKAMGVPEEERADRFNAWVRGNRETMRGIASQACASPLLPSAVAKSYENVLTRLIVKSCVVYQFNDLIVENRLYAYVADLLLAGHCVCGWDGSFPDGALVIY